MPTTLEKMIPVANPDLELRRGAGFVLLALPAFFPSVISFFFFTQNKGGGGGGGGGREGGIFSPRSATGFSFKTVDRIETIH